ncbi:MAG: hypothetical protein LBN99_03295, partial [Oscillospiraceae bacterium]|nr:hypothetical protein [Oscillospiraceae bacterium]
MKKSPNTIFAGVAIAITLFIIGLLVYILVSAILIGRPYYKLSSDRIRAVEKEMKLEFTDFSKLRFDASPPRLNMRVYIDGELDKERAVMFFSSLTGKLIIQDLK